MKASREYFDAIEPSGGLADMYWRLEGRGERLTRDAIYAACEMGEKYLKAAHADGRPLMVTFQADVTVLPADPEERPDFTYARRTPDPVLWPEYECCTARLIDIG